MDRTSARTSPNASDIFHPDSENRLFAVGIVMGANDNGRITFRPINGNDIAVLGAVYQERLFAHPIGGLTKALGKKNRGPIEDLRMRLVPRVIHLGQGRHVLPQAFGGRRWRLGPVAAIDRPAWPGKQ